MNRKSTLKLAVGVFLRMLVADIFCIVIYMTLALDFGQNVFPVILSLVLLALYIAIGYSATWYTGNEDVFLVERGELKKNIFEGAKISILAAVPVLIINLGCAALYQNNDFFGGLFNILNPQLMFFNKSRWFADAPKYLMLVALIKPAVMVLSGTVGYIAGFFKISLMKIIMYRKEDRG